MKNAGLQLSFFIFAYKRLLFFGPVNPVFPLRPALFAAEKRFACYAVEFCLLRISD